MRNAMMIDQKDNVAVVVEPVSAGDTIIWTDTEEKEHTLTARTEIPIYHKVAIQPIRSGEKIVKYGEHIGEAACDIPAGTHVHVENVRSVREELA